MESVTGSVPLRGLFVLLTTEAFSATLFFGGILGSDGLDHGQMPKIVVRERRRLYYGQSA